MAFKKTTIKSGGSFEGDMWIPHNHEPGPVVLASYKEYGNQIVRDQTVTGELRRVKLFRGDERLVLVNRGSFRLDKAGNPVEYVRDESLRDLCLPEHAALLSRVSDVERNKKGVVIGVTPSIPDGTLVEITYTGTALVKSGGNEGKDCNTYDVTTYTEE